MKMTREELRLFLAAHEFTVVHFDAAWDGYSAMVRDKIEALPTELRSLVQFAYVDCDDEQEYARELRILSVPALAYFHRADLRGVVVGQQQDIAQNIRHLTNHSFPRQSPPTPPRPLHPMKFSLTHCSAIITGASSGLGAEFARQLAPIAKSLLLVARREDALNQVKAELLAMRADLQVHLCVADVATDEGRARIVECVDIFDLKPNVLINNAGIGDYGGFADADAAKLRAQIDLNVTALVLLTHAVLPRLVAPAGILNVSSLAGNVPMPDLAVYGASKAFVTSFSEALRVELKEKNIVVSALCPGPTPTNFGKNARRADGADTNRSGQGMLRIAPEVVVRAGLDALEHNRATVFPGLGVSVAGPLFRIMPRRLMRWVLERRYRSDHSSPPP